MDNARIGNNITEYMEKLAVQEWKYFDWAYTKKDLLNQLEQVQQAKKSGRASRINRLKKSMEASGIPTNGLHELLKTEKGIKQLKEQIEDSSLPEDYKEIEKKLFKMLYDMYQAFPASEDFMKRLVTDPDRGLADEEFRSDSVRVAIVKQFMKHTSYQTAAVKKMVVEKLKIKYPDQKNFSLDTIISNIDENIFGETGTKPLLKLADDLSSGKFRTNGRTRKDLYMFAFAFGMSSSFGKDDLDYNERTNIEKNLFQDYYTDNLLRYISDEYKENAKLFQAEPSGDGINYKNFAEVIYLYYLNQDGMDAKDKIKQAESLIKECASENQESVPEQSCQQTQFFQDICKQNQVSKLSREDFKKFILENYRLPSGQRSSADITVDDDTRTASEKLDSIYKSILELDSDIQDDLRESGSIYHMILGAYADFSATSMVNDYRIAKEEILKDYSDDENFKILIHNLDKKLDITKKIIYLQEHENAHVTRADLIAAGFYYFQLKHMDYVEDEKIISLQDIYEEFCSFIDNYLEQSRFQKMNPKNLFDMYVVSALYQAVNFG
ncbi:MAG: hypothetical protein K2L07_13185 [Lachnospiraceae bacterium]|nr:hypothetical protein [Lachnospiraceae bacterium]